MLAKRSRLLAYERDDVVYHERQPAAWVWLLLAGRIGIFKYTSHDLTLLLESIEPGGLFGALCTAQNSRASYPCTALALEPSKVLGIEMNAFRECLNTSPPLSSWFCRAASEACRSLVEARGIDYEPVPIRTVMKLCQLDEIYGHSLPFTKKHLAAFVGTSVESIFRVLAGLKRKNLVASGQKSLRLLDLPALRALARKHL